VRESDNQKEERERERERFINRENSGNCFCIIIYEHYLGFCLCIFASFSKRCATRGCPPSRTGSRASGRRRLRGRRPQRISPKRTDCSRTRPPSATSGARWPPAALWPTIRTSWPATASRPIAPPISSCRLRRKLRRCCSRLRRCLRRRQSARRATSRVVHGQLTRSIYQSTSSGQLWST